MADGRAPQPTPRGRRRQVRRASSRRDAAARRRSGSRCRAVAATAPGQHYVVRLTAPDGYTASRSYSVASAPDELERVRAHRRAARGRRGVDVPARRRRGRRRARGPRARSAAGSCGTATRPALLVGGGSGVVPLMAMLRLARATGRSDLVRLVVSVRTPRRPLLRRRAARARDARSCTRAPRRRRRPRPPGRLTRADIAQPLRRPTRPPTCAARPGSPTPPATSSSTSGQPDRADPGRALRPDGLVPTVGYQWMPRRSCTIALAGSESSWRSGRSARDSPGTKLTAGSIASFGRSSPRAAGDSGKI